MNKRTSRKQVETILSSISTDDIEYRLVSHEYLSGSKYTYTYSICCYIDGKHNHDVISSTTLKKAYERANQLLFDE